MGRHTATWKAHERRTAAALGAVRVGNTGAASPDARSEWLVIECKSRAALPAWIKDAMQQAEAGAGEYQLPIVVLHELGGRALDDLVILRRSEFEAWFGGWRGRDDDATGA
jgi:hypothetical protein